MIERIVILNAIFSNFQQITQWLPSNIENAAEYMHKAEALIEILEVDDCGSVGGYDPHNPVEDESGFELYDRFLALVRKRNNISEIQQDCGFDVEKLKKYFLKLSKLRNYIFLTQQ
jgi:hypothetical protein